MTGSRERTLLPSDELPLISAKVLRELVSMADAIEASSRGFAAAARGEIRVPLRSTLCSDRVLIMPAEHVSGSGVIKVICPALGAAKGVAPGVDGTVLWIDGDSGTVGALLDVTTLTALRTGAASGLATSLLARPDAAVLAMIGCGLQAMDQIDAICTVRPIGEIRLHSRNHRHSLVLREQVRAARPGVRCQTVRTPAEAVRGADVVCTATRSTAPLFAAADLGSSVHINAIGAFRPDMCEVPSEAFKKADLVVVDQVDAALAEAGDVIQALAAGALVREELIQIGSLIGTYATSRGGVTIFKSVGIAAQDWSMAELSVRRAREAGLLPG